MTKPVVLLDVDGVLADFVAGYLELVHDVTGMRFDHCHVDQFYISRALGLTDQETAEIATKIQQPGFCSDLRPLEGAVDAVRRLQEIADVYIVTSPWNSCPTWTHEREKWIAKHLGIHHSRVIHTSAKHLVRGDVLVDDKAETIIAWNDAHPGKTAVLWEAPWNKSAPWAGVSTNDWDRVCRLVEAIS